MPKNILYVEGVNDLFFIAGICDSFGIPCDKRPKDVEIFNNNSGSDTQAIEAFKTAIKPGGSNIIGLVVDADENFDARRASLNDILTKKQYTQTDKENIFECKSDIDMPKVGVWIMPNNSSKGRVEDFFREIVCVNKELLDDAQKIVYEIENKEYEQKFIPNHRQKAIIHTWLAWHNEPGGSMGLAVRKKMIDEKDELCLKFVNWLKNLYEL